MKQDSSLSQDSGSATVGVLESEKEVKAVPGPFRSSRQEPLPSGDDGEEEASPRPVHTGAMTSSQSAGAGGISGVRKAAVFILSLDEEVASHVLRTLSDDELARITSEIANLGVVDNETVAGVIREFRELEQLHSLVREGGLEQAVRLVEKTFPREKAARVVQSLKSHEQRHAFAFLDEVEVETLLACMEEEHPQTLAVILAHMTPGKAAEVLERLPPAARKDVLERIAGLEGANADALRGLEVSLRKHLDHARFKPLGEAGGVRTIAHILRAAGGGISYLEDLRSERPDLVDEIGRQLFLFEDLASLEDQAFEALLKDMDTRRLALALKNANERLKNKVFGNLTRRAGDLLREEMDALGPVRFAEVQAAQRSIVETALKLEEAGQLYISGRGREENRIVY